MSSDNKPATIAYNVENSGDITIDIEIEDFSKDTIERFAVLFASISSLDFQTQAVEMIKEVFESKEKIKEFQEFADLVFAHSVAIAKSEQSYIQKTEGDKDDVPVIQPKDLL